MTNFLASYSAVHSAYRYQTTYRHLQSLQTLVDRYIAFTEHHSFNAEGGDEGEFRWDIYKTLPADTLGWCGFRASWGLRIVPSVVYINQTN